MGTSSPTGIENRRSPRIVKRVPLRVIEGEAQIHDAYSAVINMHGALIISEKDFVPDSVVALENVFNGSRTRARIVWSGGHDAAGVKLGVEFLDGVDFWGDDYNPDARD